MSPGFRRAGSSVQPFGQGLLAEIEAETEGPDATLTRIDEALALAGDTGEHWSDAVLHRIRGDILLKHDQPNTAQAEEAFLTAIAIAKKQYARIFELRAATSMARLWRDQGKRLFTRGNHSPQIDLQSNIQVSQLRCVFVDRTMILKSGFVKVLRASRRSESVRRAGAKKSKIFCANSEGGGQKKARFFARPPRLMATSNPSISSSPWIRRIWGAAEWRSGYLVLLQE